MPLHGAPAGAARAPREAGLQHAQERDRRGAPTGDAVALQRAPAAELALPSGAFDVPGHQVQDGRGEDGHAHDPTSSGAGAPAIRSISKVILP